MEKLARLIYQELTRLSGRQLEYHAILHDVLSAIESDNVELMTEVLESLRALVCIETEVNSRKWICEQCKMEHAQELAAYERMNDALVKANEGLVSQLSRLRRRHGHHW